MRCMNVFRCPTMLVLFFFFSSLSPAYAYTAWTGESVSGYCKLLLQFMDKNEAAKDAFQAAEAASCSGYLNGFIDANLTQVSASGSQNAGSNHQTFCLPKDATIHGVVKIVVSYMDQHKNQLNSPAEGLVMQALITAYPCGKN